MKTKIIYISGNEVFDMADIRAAFEEVRNTLGLGKDTVMFGVPVDSDDALNSVNNISVNADNAVAQEVAETVAVNNSVEPTTIANTVIETVEVEKSDIEEEPAPKNIKKSTTRKSRSHSKEKNSEPVAESVDATQPDNSEKIIPILSILAAKKDDEAEAEKTEEIAETDVIEPEIAEEVPESDSEETVSESAMPDIDIGANFESEKESNEHSAAIADMITDDAPEAPVEKTLEQLLESMTPLREDVVDETEEAVISDDSIDAEDAEIAVVEDDTDATLEQLAAEFAENQDKIPSQPKSETHSKIGKLKNILPFKKAKRDDSGLMGDLFGWAGIAANDDDFSIPGFFTNAASKK